MEPHKNEAPGHPASETREVAFGDLDADEASPVRPEGGLRPEKVELKKEGRTGSTSARHQGGNSLRKLRMERMLSKAELARRAQLSTLTIDRIERGMPCRMDTKRKVLEALSLKPEDRAMVFGDDDD